MFPMAVMSIILARPVGNLTDRLHPRLVVGTGFVLSIIGMFALATQVRVGSATWLICVCQVILGAGNAFIWAPTAATANRNLPMSLAGAGAGVYNAARQVGSVVGSAAIAVMMDARLAHYLPGASSKGEAGAAAIQDQHVAELFSKAMQQALLLPASLYIVGLIAVLFYEKPKHVGYGGAVAAPSGVQPAAQPAAQREPAAEPAAEPV